MILFPKIGTYLRRIVALIIALTASFLPTSCANPNEETQGPTCSIGIYCTTILNNMDMLDESKAVLIPHDGVILELAAVSFKSGETVYDVLKSVTRKNSIHMESNYTPLYNSAYVEGIANIYEYDCGEMSGWTYSVNDIFPNYGCSSYVLKDGDVIKWMYTCDLGRDVGGSFE